MTDQQLLEHYMGLKVALSEYGFDEKVVNAYIATSTEICMKYFDERGLVDLEAREKLRRQLEEKEEFTESQKEMLKTLRKAGYTDDEIAYLEKYVRQDFTYDQLYDLNYLRAKENKK